MSFIVWSMTRSTCVTMSVWSFCFMSKLASKRTNLVFLASFSSLVLIHLRSISKQVISTYIKQSRPLIPDGIHLNFERGLREARPVLMCWALSKEASGTIFLASLVERGGGSNPRPPAHGANALPLSHRCGFSHLLFKHLTFPNSCLNTFIYWQMKHCLLEPKYTIIIFILKMSITILSKHIYRSVENLWNLVVFEQHVRIDYLIFQCIHIC